MKYPKTLAQCVESVDQLLKFILVYPVLFTNFLTAK